MWPHLCLVVASSLAACAQAFAPLMWTRSPGESLVLVPKATTSPFRGKIPFEELTIRPLSALSAQTIPRFSVTQDDGIRSDQDRCVEAGGNRNGDAIHVNSCTGGPFQKWKWLSPGNLQLQGTSKCLDVVEGNGLNAASVQLGDCDSERTVSWSFMEPGSATPVHTSNHSVAHNSDIWHWLLAFASVGMISLLTVIGALRSRLTRARVIAPSPAGMVASGDLEGVALAMSCDGHEPEVRPPRTRTDHQMTVAAPPAEDVVVKKGISTHGLSHGLSTLDLSFAKERKKTKPSGGSPTGSTPLSDSKDEPQSSSDADGSIHALTPTDLTPAIDKFLESGLGNEKQEDLLMTANGPAPEGPDPSGLVADEIQPLQQYMMTIAKDENPVVAMTLKDFFKRQENDFRPTVVALVGKALSRGDSDLVRTRQLQLGQMVELMQVATTIHNNVTHVAADMIRHERERLTLGHGRRRRTRWSGWWRRHRWRSRWSRWWGWWRRWRQVQKHDGDDSGKGKAQKGIQAAVLAGDFMLARASVLLGKLQNTQVVEVMASALDSLIQGEVKEDVYDLDQYLRKVYFKTASLISRGCKSVALLADYDQEDEMTLAAEEFGYHLGMVAQIIEDTVRFVDAKVEAFSSLGADAARREGCNLYAAPFVFANMEEPSLQALMDRKFKEEGDIERAFVIAKGTDCVEKSYRLAESHASKGIEALMRFPESESRDALMRLMHQFVSRRSSGSLVPTVGNRSDGYSIEPSIDLTPAVEKFARLPTGETMKADVPMTARGPVPEGPDPFKLVAEDLKPLSDWIKKLLKSENPVLKKSSTYLFKQKGKRFRPTILALLASVLPCRDNREDTRSRQLQIGQITEMIHTASLVHDDVLDDADTRRGADSVQTKYGIKVAVLAGDFLLAWTSVLLGRLRSPQVVEVMSSSLDALVQGEIMQARAKKTDLTDMTHYLRKSYYKTASLISTSCRSIALLAGYEGDHVLTVAAEGFGYHLGMAYQIVDDILDFTGASAELGKPAQADMKLGLTTAPILFASEKEPSLKKLIERKFVNDGDIPKAIKLAQGTDCVERSYQLAEFHAQKGVDALMQMPDCESRKALTILMHLVLSRNK